MRRYRWLSGILTPTTDFAWKMTPTEIVRGIGDRDTAGAGLHAPYRTAYGRLPQLSGTRYSAEDWSRVRKCLQLGGTSAGDMRDTGCRLWLVPSTLPGKFTEPPNPLRGCPWNYCTQPTEQCPAQGLGSYFVCCTSSVPNPIQFGILVPQTDHPLIWCVCPPFCQRSGRYGPGHQDVRRKISRLQPSC